MNAEMSGLLNGPGYAPIAVICCLILLEELGIPMPFAPGDLLLVIAGASIATGRVSPLVVVPAIYFSAVAGAMAGREIFERLGSSALPRIAKLPRAGKRVDVLTLRLRRGGAPAVFVGRITPGLRIVTTYASGLLSMPRRTFAKGLLPGVALYQAVFVAMGAWLGRAAWSTIERHAPNPGEVVLLLGLVAMALLVAHAFSDHIRGALPNGRRTLEVKA